MTRQNDNLPSFSWPVDEDGVPMALVTMTLSELINVGNYSNVTVGPGTVTRFVRNNDEDIANGLVNCAEHVENILASEREPVLNMVNGGS